MSSVFRPSIFYGHSTHPCLSHIHQCCCPSLPSLCHHVIVSCSVYSVINHHLEGSAGSKQKRGYSCRWFLSDKLKPQWLAAEPLFRLLLKIARGFSYHNLTGLVTVGLPWVYYWCMLRSRPVKLSGFVSLQQRYRLFCRDCRRVCVRSPLLYVQTNPVTGLAAELFTIHS